MTVHALMFIAQDIVLGRILAEMHRSEPQTLYMYMHQVNQACYIYHKNCMSRLLNWAPHGNSSSKLQFITVVVTAIRIHIRENQACGILFKLIKNEMLPKIMQYIFRMYSRHKAILSANALIITLSNHRLMRS